MTWARLDGHYWHDPKVRRVGPQAELLYVRSIAWCAANLTDGAIPSADVGSMMAGLRQGRRLPMALVGAGLWVEMAGGWAIPPGTWARWQRTKAQVEEDRTDAAARARRYRAKRRNAVTPEPEMKRHGVTERSVTRPDTERDVVIPINRIDQHVREQPAGAFMDQVLHDLAARFALPPDFDAGPDDTR